MARFRDMIRVTDPVRDPFWTAKGGMLAYWRASTLAAAPASRLR